MREEPDLKEDKADHEHDLTENIADIYDRGEEEYERCEEDDYTPFCDLDLFLLICHMLPPQENLRYFVSYFMMFSGALCRFMTCPDIQIITFICFIFFLLLFVFYKFDSIFFFSINSLQGGEIIVISQKDYTDEVV